MHMVNLHLSHQAFLSKAHCRAHKCRTSAHVPSRVIPDCSRAVILETAMLRPTSVLNTRKTSSLTGIRLCCSAHVHGLIYFVD
jgi:hypothetical protein